MKQSLCHIFSINMTIKTNLGSTPAGTVWVPGGSMKGIWPKKNFSAPGGMFEPMNKGVNGVKFG